MTRSYTLRTARKQPDAATDAFAPGSVVVHPARGVFTVADTRIMQVDGEAVPALILAPGAGSGSLAVPLPRAREVLRPLSPPAVIEEALSILRQVPRRRRMPWAQRAQKHAVQIKDGDPRRLAETLRDVHHPPRAGEQSWGERQVFYRALQRFVAEFAAVARIGWDEATARVVAALDARIVMRPAPPLKRSARVQEAAVKGER